MAIACTRSMTTGSRVSESGSPTWRLVYRHDADGGHLSGSKADLLAAIRAGAPVRIAWGVSVERDGRSLSVEHSADPVFLSIVNQSEVVVQLPEHIAQRSYVDDVSPGFDSPAVMWRGLMSTNGTFDAVWVDRATGTEVRRSSQKAGLAWFAWRSDGEDAQASLELAVPGGVGYANEPVAK